MSVTIENDPLAYSQAAVSLRERGDLAGAETMAAEARARFPDFLGAALIWADLAVRQRDWPLAAARWGEVRAQFPTEPAGYTESARALAESGDNPGAEATASEARRRFPDHFGSAVVWAEAAMRRGSWAEAVRRWTILQAQYPHEALPLVECAGALRRAGDQEAARGVLSDAHVRFPTADRPLHDLARMAEERGDWAEAARLWHAYTETKPPVWFSFTGEAHALRRLDRLEEAEAVLLMARLALPHAAPPLHDLARLAEHRGDWLGAENHWKAYRALRPDEWLSYTGLASATRQQKKFESARALLVEAVIKFPGEAAPLHDLARLAEEQRDWTAAAEAWAEYRAKFATAWFSFSGGAHALRQLGRLDEAEALFRESVRKFPDEFGPLRGLVDLLVPVGRFSDAIDAVEAALIRTPTKPELVLLRTELAVKLNRKDDAFASWQRISPGTPDLFRRKLLFACDILDLDAAAAHAPELLAFLVSEADTGGIGWVPRSASFLHRAMLLKDPPIAALTAFYQDNQGLFAQAPHRLIWLALLGLEPTETDLDDVMEEVVARGRFGLASSLFSAYVLDTHRAWCKAVLARLTAHIRIVSQRRVDLSDPAACLEIVLCLAIASMYLDDDFWDLVTGIRGRVSDDDAPEDAPASARRILARFLDKVATAGRISGAPAVIGRRDQPLRIAVCVSGQLRGYQQAFPTWEALGLFKHECGIFVHSWRDVGLNWMRNWEFFRHSHAPAYAVLARSEGPEILAEHFPTLAHAASGGVSAKAYADEATLRNFYGTDFVALEYDTQAPFAARPNDWKMLYKIQQAHQMALASGKEFDLYLRIRPDIALDVAGELDFHEFAAQSTMDHCLFLDSPVLFTAPDGRLKAGDQIAMGTLAPMSAYANTISFDPAGAALLGAPPAPKAHETLGNALFAQGVVTRSIQGLRAKSLLNPAVLTPTQVADLAEADAARAPATDFAKQILDACRRVSQSGDR